MCGEVVGRGGEWAPIVQDLLKNMRSHNAVSAGILAGNNNYGSYSLSYLKLEYEY